MRQQLRGAALTSRPPSVCNAARRERFIGPISHLQLTATRYNRWVRLAQTDGTDTSDTVFVELGAIGETVETAA